MQAQTIELNPKIDNAKLRAEYDDLREKLLAAEKNRLNGARRYSLSEASEIIRKSIGAYEDGAI